jgi:hypothetical protein
VPSDLVYDDIRLQKISFFVICMGGTYTLNINFGVAPPKQSVIQKPPKIPKNSQNQSVFSVLRFQFVKHSGFKLLLLEVVDTLYNFEINLPKFVSILDTWP